MPQHKVVSSKEPIRLFQSDFLELFTHISPLVVLIIWLPASIFFLTLSILNHPAQSSWWNIPVGFVVGLLFWTLAEYVLHRFLFHFKPRNAWQERISFLFHGVHHAQPMSKTRLVMPPALSIPLSLVFLGIFYLVLDVLLGVGHWVLPTFAGFLTGYLIYDMLHYSMHHFRMKRGYWKLIRRHHMFHHGQTPEMRFGVSSPLWDYVFGTNVG